MHPCSWGAAPSCILVLVVWLASAIVHTLRSLLASSTCKYPLRTYQGTMLLSSLEQIARICSISGSVLFYHWLTAQYLMQWVIVISSGAFAVYLILRIKCWYSTPPPAMAHRCRAGVECIGVVCRTRARMLVTAFKQSGTRHHVACQWFHTAVCCSPHKTWWSSAGQGSEECNRSSPREK